MDNSTTVSTIGGTLLSVVTISTTTILSTVIVAIIGATTSFFVSLVLKKLWNYFTKKKTN